MVACRDRLQSARLIFQCFFGEIRLAVSDQCFLPGRKLLMHTAFETRLGMSNEPVAPSAPGELGPASSRQRPGIQRSHSSERRRQNLCRTLCRNRGFHGRCQRWNSHARRCAVAKTGVPLRLVFLAIFALFRARVRGAGRFVDTVEVYGSNPYGPTIPSVVHPTGSIFRPFLPWIDGPPRTSPLRAPPRHLRCHPLLKITEFCHRLLAAWVQQRRNRLPPELCLGSEDSVIIPPPCPKESTHPTPIARGASSRPSSFRRDLLFRRPLGSDLPHGPRPPVQPLLAHCLAVPDTALHVGSLSPGRTTRL